MKASSMMPSKYLKKEDIDKPTLCTIKKLSQADVSQDESGDLKWTVYFNELPKPMVLNVSNINALTETHGDETDNWPGKSIVVYVDPNVMFSGKKVGGIRLRAAKQGANTKPPHDGFEDQTIPF